ncbi:hypothetical protein JCM14124_26340 [Humidesulfovibrio idahonensis]
MAAGSAGKHSARAARAAPAKKRRGVEWNVRGGKVGSMVSPGVTRGHSGAEGQRLASARLVSLAAASVMTDGLRAYWAG